MKNKLPATLLPIGRIRAMKSQFRGCLRLGFFLFIAASVLPTIELVAQCSVSNTVAGFYSFNYTSSGQSFVPTCTNTLVSVSFEGIAGVSMPDQVDVIYGEPGNSSGILYSIGNPQWSGNTHTLPFSVSVTSGQTYTVLFIRRFASDPCLHSISGSNPIPSGRVWGYIGTYGSGGWVTNAADADLTCSITIGSCTAPAFTACPSNITVNAGASTCNAAVSYTATASGIPAPSLTYTFSGATTGSGSGTGSGSTFNRGVTTVVLTATNSCGSPTCSFTVTVNDATAPTITCPANVDIPVNPACAGFIGVYTPVSVSDNCTANPTVTQSPSAGTTFFGHGSTQTIRLTATDGAGNTKSCTFTATLKDVTPPTVTCKNATVNLDANGAASVTTADVFQSGSDNCGTVNQVSVLPNTFSCTNIGTNTVTLLVNDGHGNTATCLATVTVVDNINPTLVCKNATVNLDNNGAASITTSDVLQSITDNCSTQFNQIVVFPNAFFCNNIGTNIVPVYVIGDGNNYCLATVTVVDNINPTVVCKNATVNLDNSGAASITTANVFQSGADNCGQVNQVSVLPNTFSCINIGSNIVTLLVNDGHGNTNTCLATVTITDDNHACAPLPVELVAFKAIAEKDAIQLNWQTASERNNAGFQIERSENGRDFEKIAFIMGAGTSAEKHTYQLKDKEVRAGQIYFYRLQQMDYDGHFQYSNIVQATLSGGKMTLFVSPNPAPTNSVIQLQIHLPQASEMVLTLFDVQGRLIRSERHDLEANLQILEMPIDDLPANAYFLKATANGESVYQKLIITK